MNSDAPIGVFDSGMGGLSLLHIARQHLPHEHFIFIGDNKNAPYGLRTEQDICRLSENIANQLADRGAKAIVIACNTATSASAKYLRQKFTMPVIGMEPALKPANTLRKNGKILVMATPATIRQNKFIDLMEKYGEHAIPVSCTGIVELVEQGIISGDMMDHVLKDNLNGYFEMDVSVVVLGCTHYVFVRAAIEALFPKAIVIDGNFGTVQQLTRLLQANDLLLQHGDGSITLETTSEDPKIISIMGKLLSLKL